MCRQVRGAPMATTTISYSLGAKWNRSWSSRARLRIPRSKPATSFRAERNPSDIAHFLQLRFRAGDFLFQFLCPPMKRFVLLPPIGAEGDEWLKTGRNLLIKNFDRLLDFLTCLFCQFGGVQLSLGNLNHSPALH